MLRALEAGLVKKWLHTIKYTKPECQAGATVHPVAIDGVLAAFYILICKYEEILCIFVNWMESIFLIYLSVGGILAIIILIAEKLNYKYNFKLDLVYEGYLPWTLTPYKIKLIAVPLLFPFDCHLKWNEVITYLI